jgi:hypothetical protein
MNDRASRCVAAYDSPLREAIGAYLLGALDPVESDRVAEHLSECSGCRADYGELTELLPLLASVTEDEAINGPVQPEPAVLGRVLRSTAQGERQGPAWRAGKRAQRHRGEGVAGKRPRRVRVALAAAALVIAGAGSGTGVLLSGGGNAMPGSWSATAVVEAYVGAPQITTTVQVEPAAHGSMIQLRMDRVPAGYSCTMVVVDANGNGANAGTWTANTDGPFTIPGWSGLSPGSIKSIQITLPNGSTLLSLNHPA